LLPASATIMALQVSAAEFLQFGLAIAGFDELHQQRTRAVTNRRHFRGHYDISPEACSVIFSDLQTMANPVASIDRPDTTYFMMVLYWLNSYQQKNDWWDLSTLMRRQQGGGFGCTAMPSMLCVSNRWVKNYQMYCTSILPFLTSLSWLDCLSRLQQQK
jgi:hypothetical protein